MPTADLVDSPAMPVTRWDELGGFAAAMTAGDPHATFVSQLLPLPIVAPLLFWLAAGEGRIVPLALTWGVGVIALQIIWIMHLRREELPRPALVHCFMSGTCALTTLALPSLWLAVQALVLMNFALVVASGHRKAIVFHLFCAGFVAINGLEFASTELLPTWAYLLLLPILAGTAVSAVSSHVEWQERKVGTSLEAVGASAWDIDADGRVTTALGAAVGPVEAGVLLADVMHPDDCRPDDIHPGSVFEYRISDGRKGWLWVRETVEAGVTSGAVIRSAVSDITREQKAAALTEQMARFDQLTGLPNRPAHMEEADQWAAAGRGHLMLIDLDHFKRVNDSVGHAVGDQVLKIVAKRFAAVEPVIHLARLGGDEFAALVDVDRSAARKAADQIAAATNDPISLDGLIVSVGASVGFAQFEAGVRPDEVRRRADTALTHAKGGMQAVIAYDESLERNNKRRLELARRLPSALASGEIIVYHQPKLDLTSRSIIGTEALVRWRHPDEGLVMPGDFLDLVALGGHLRTLTRVVVRAALTDLAAAHRSGHDWTVAVNVDGRNLREPDFASMVRAELEVAGLEPRHLVLELTEEAIIDEDPIVEQTLVELNEAGHRLSIDDFGTGFSSLAYLGRLPVSEIKLDRALISGLLTSDRDRAIVESTLSLAAELGMNVVAEGIEDSDTLELLSDLGCPVAQGYFIARPGPSTDLLDSAGELSLA